MSTGSYEVTCAPGYRFNGKTCVPIKQAAKSAPKPAPAPAQTPVAQPNPKFVEAAAGVSMGALTPQPNVGLGNCPTGNCGDNDYMSFNRGKQLAQGAPMSVMEELAAASVLNHFKNDVAGARRVTDFAMTNELLNNSGVQQYISEQQRAGVPADLAIANAITAGGFKSGYNSFASKNMLDAAGLANKAIDQRLAFGIGSGTDTPNVYYSGAGGHNIAGQNAAGITRSAGTSGYSTGVDFADNRRVAVDNSKLPAALGGVGGPVGLTVNNLGRAMQDAAAAANQAELQKQASLANINLANINNTAGLNVAKVSADAQIEAAKIAANIAQLEAQNKRPNTSLAALNTAREKGLITPEAYAAALANMGIPVMTAPPAATAAPYTNVYGAPYTNVYGAP